MGTIYLVRHGQASFGAADYDQLSPLGHQQSVRLGEHWREHGLRFDAVLTGSLRRHRQTWEGLAQGLGWAAEPLVWPGLNEYDSEAVIEAIHAQPPAHPTSPEGYRQHFRLLRDGLRQWMAGVVSPRGMPTYPEFLHGVTSALEHARTQHRGNVLVVSSGGPISTAVGHVLGTTPETTIEMNLRMRNTSVSELAHNPKRCTLVSFNTLPHLSSPAHADWVTHA
ncbi:histidine phosphatase family protein [Aquabacterium sp. A08]|uniref:histidine phosphatase family protein n=1 Tax=Aquabacterium sp. A08 TaxID=2718532 RepID=UPI0014224665|nr:histidine phosphatase family protein [Aquabacterium sp. A08]NIC43019.1 histidine phosphatase family protein [Aquabacterium sp. A08]